MCQSLRVFCFLVPVYVSFDGYYSANFHAVSRAISIISVKPF